MERLSKRILLAAGIGVVSLTVGTAAVWNARETVRLNRLVPQTTFHIPFRYLEAPSLWGSSTRSQIVTCFTYPEFKPCHSVNHYSKANISLYILRVAPMFYEIFSINKFVGLNEGYKIDPSGLRYLQKKPKYFSNRTRVYFSKDYGETPLIIACVQIFPGARDVCSAAQSLQGFAITYHFAAEFLTDWRTIHTGVRKYLSQWRHAEE